MKIVDVHAHVLPPAVLREWRRGRWGFPNVSVEVVNGIHSFSFPTGVVPPCPPDLLDVAGSVGRLDSQGITSAVVAPWIELVGYGLPSVEGASWARFLNERALDLHRDEPRLIPLATVPLQDSKLAAKEVETAREMRFAGVAIGTMAGDRELDHPSLLAFWEAVDATSMPVFLHPMLHRGDRRIGDDFGFGLANSVGRVIDTTIAVTRLLYSGTLARFPRLKVLIAHGGASIPYIRGRLRRAHEIAPRTIVDPGEGFDRLYFDTLLYEPAALRFLVDIVGASRVLLGSDHPFPNRDPEPRRIVAEAFGDADITEALLGGNAMELFDLESH